jgi:hypothetical protein
MIMERFHESLRHLISSLDGIILDPESLRIGCGLVRQVPGVRR